MFIGLREIRFRERKGRHSNKTTCHFISFKVHTCNHNISLHWGEFEVMFFIVVARRAFQPQFFIAQLHFKSPLVTWRLPSFSHASLPSHPSHLSHTTLPSDHSHPSHPSYPTQPTHPIHLSHIVVIPLILVTLLFPVIPVPPVILVIQHIPSDPS